MMFSKEFSREFTNLYHFIVACSAFNKVVAYEGNCSAGGNFMWRADWVFYLRQNWSGGELDGTVKCSVAVVTCTGSWK